MFGVWKAHDNLGFRPFVGTTSALFLALGALFLVAAAARADLLFNNGVVNVFSGSDGNVTVTNGTTLDLISASINALPVYASSVVNLSGGSIGFLNAGCMSTINIYGFGLQLVPNGPGNAIVTGTLSDGTPIEDLVLENGGAVILHNLPEPAALLLAGIGVLTLAGFRKRQDSRR